ncbi:hypothetical protein B5M42_020260 [Paenibacillus athensensis]|uniref:Uncharacterized protein n=1 Tax=Paenibacillus athensensis TaxID=1967502 RepID=A0A4Y8Q153_9BACL|nr:hypothetical protein [Paenibacillus athensensis]MCD1261139.1 hypothetical protein [Paenibacillus athensensis]
MLIPHHPSAAAGRSAIKDNAARPAPVTAALPDHQAGVASLQRAVGNRAVGQLMQARRSAGAAGRPAAGVQRETAGAAAEAQREPEPGQRDRTALGSAALSGESSVQRAAEGDAPAPATAPAPASAAKSGSGVWIVEDGEPATAGQLPRSEFMAKLREEIVRIADEVLAPLGQTSAHCPYIPHWFGFYEGKDARHIEQSIRRYAPDTAGAADWQACLALVGRQVKTAFQMNVQSGSLEGVPEELPRDLEERPGSATPSEQAAPVAAAADAIAAALPAAAAPGQAAAAAVASAAGPAAAELAPAPSAAMPAALAAAPAAALGAALPPAAVPAAPAQATPDSGGALAALSAVLTAGEPRVQRALSAAPTGLIQLCHSPDVEVQQPALRRQLPVQQPRALPAMARLLEPIGVPSLARAGALAGMNDADAVQALHGSAKEHIRTGVGRDDYRDLLGGCTSVTEAISNYLGVQYPNAPMAGAKHVGETPFTSTDALGDWVAQSGDNVFFKCISQGKSHEWTMMKRGDTYDLYESDDNPETEAERSHAFPAGTQRNAGQTMRGGNLQQLKQALAQMAPRTTNSGNVRDYHVSVIPMPMG